MGDERVSCAERRVSWTREEASHTVLALATDVERTCRRCFPRAAGYETKLTNLRGLVDGVRVSVSRGSFHAVVSTHYFLDDRADADGWAIRMVAAARQRPQVQPKRPPAGQRLALALGLAGTIIVLLAAFGASGLWGYFRLSLLMSFLVMMTPALAWLSSAKNEALEAATSWPALPPGDDDFTRWQQTLDEMKAEEALFVSRRALPFR